MVCHRTNCLPERCSRRPHDIASQPKIRLTRVKNNLKNILAIIKIAFEYDEIALLEIRKYVRWLGGETPIRMLSCPKIIGTNDDSAVRIEFCKSCDEKV